MYAKGILLPFWSACLAKKENHLAADTRRHFVRPTWPNKRGILFANEVSKVLNVMILTFENVFQLPERLDIFS